MSSPPSSKVKDCSATVHNDYVRKLYILIAIQFAFEYALSWYLINTTDLDRYHDRITVIADGVFFGLCLLGMQCFKSDSAVQIMFVIAGGLFKAYISAWLCIALGRTSTGGVLFFHSLAILSVEFLLLSIHTSCMHMKVKVKYHLMYVSGMIMFLTGSYAGLVHVFSPDTMENEICIAGIVILLISAYLVFDVWDLTHRMRPEQVFKSAAYLFLDFCSHVWGLLYLLWIICFEVPDPSSVDRAVATRSAVVTPESVSTTISD